VAEIELLLASTRTTRGAGWALDQDAGFRSEAATTTGARGRENPLYRRRRERFNEEVLGAARAQRTYAAPETVGEIDEIEAMPSGRERDARINTLAEELNRHAVIESEFFIPPTEGGPRAATRRVDTATRPELDAPYRQRRAALARSIRGGAVDERTLAQGVMGETRRFELADGTSAVYKRALSDYDQNSRMPIWTKKDQTDAEELAAITAAAVGERAPAVHRASEDEIYMELMPGRTAAEKYGAGFAPRSVVDSPDGRRLGLLDVLVDNTDRNGSNYLLDGQDRLSAIDHGFAFKNTNQLGEAGAPQRASTARSNATSIFAENYTNPNGRYILNELTPADAAHLRRQIDGVRREFESRGHEDWWLSMSERLAQLAARAAGDTNLY
jgi:hypothetical protein